MFCKHCGKEIANDSVFCKYCGTNQNEKLTTVAPKTNPLKVDVNGEVGIKLTPFSNSNWINKLSSFQKNCIVLYSVWFLVHVLLLISGKGRNHFYPYIHKGKVFSESFYEHMRNFGWAHSPEEEWMIDWDIDYYGLPEFIVYVALVPLLVFLGYRMYKSYKAQ